MKKKFSIKTKEQIVERDKKCFLCDCSITDPHHAFYGTHRPIGFNGDINGLWNGIGLCRDCHNGFHHTAKFYNGKSIKENRILTEKIAQERYENRN